MFFRPVTLGDRALLDGYMCPWGEGSCQHSFAAMYCMEEKYGDMFCPLDGYVAVLRAGRCRDGVRTYLFPMGDPGDRAGLGRALEAIVADAHSHGAAAQFETVTERARDALEALMPGRFRAEERRDMAEYLYTYEKLAELPGPEMRSRRHEVSAFFNRYGDRVRIERMDESHIDQVRAFQHFWMTSGQSREEDVQMELENTAIEKGLAAFTSLGLSGIVVYIDDACVGYAYGAPLSPTHYDVMIEKGDRRAADIYRVLNRELVRRCCAGYAWINREEDVGVEGLRQAKMSYKPDRLMKKYLMTEIV